MKKATLAQGNQILNLVLQSKITSDQLQDVINSGILSDVLMANVAVLDRKKFKEALGLMSEAKEPVLCYIEGNAAFFTTRELSRQWGDDWNDAPYDCNAGRPYKPCWHNEPRHVAERGGRLCTGTCCKNDWNEDGTPKWKIVRVHWEGLLATPAEPTVGPRRNSAFSVADINAGMTPWLRSTSPTSPKHARIMAGTPLSKFIRTVRRVGGWAEIVDD